ncbi:hypothetical protein HZC32_02475 [Candidatus Woesearchaeota archaeon]|nr:hypothetical protein [Candidatus Woesearchaeota archaeon]
MLYLHSLSHLTPKAAEVESVPLIREIKQKVGYPLTEQKLKEHLSQFFIIEDDLNKMELSLLLVEPTLELVAKLAEEKNVLHEPASLVRAKQVLDEMPSALDKNIQFAKEIAAWQEGFIKEAVQVFDALPRVSTPEEKIAFNNKFNEFFQMILRTQEFTFSFWDVVHEAHVSHINGLLESLNKGFLFHYTLEEELKKLEFEQIRRRIPAERLEEVEKIRKNVMAIKTGINRSYQVNKRMVDLAVYLYSYIKWLSHPPL